MKLLAGTITITTAGTSQRFASEAKEAIYAIVFRAKTGNAGKFYLGGSDVSASVGMEMDPGDSISMELPAGREAALSDFYGDVAANGDQLDYLAAAR